MLTVYDIYADLYRFVMDVDTLWFEQFQMVLFMSITLLSQAV